LSDIGQCFEISWRRFFVFGLGIDLINTEPEAKRGLSLDCHIGDPLSRRRPTPSRPSCAYETPSVPTPFSHTDGCSAAWLADARCLRRSRRRRRSRRCRCRQCRAWRADGSSSDTCRLGCAKRARSNGSSWQGGAP
jgi:hypothetical protein